MTLNPEIWGPHYWFVLHTISLNYPHQPGFLERRNHYDFFRLLQYILPCETCRNHYNQYFKNFPIENFLGSRDGLTSWVTNLHNSVNKRNGKEEYSQQSSNQLYKDIYTKENGLESYFCKNLVASMKGKEDSNPTDLPYSSPTTNVPYIFLVLIITILIVGGIVFIIYSTLK